MKKLLFAVFSLLLHTVPVHADTAHITYAFSIQNAPGGIGDFSWAVTTLGLLPDGQAQFSSFNALSAPSSGGGCHINSVLLGISPGGISMTTFFTPLCLGLFDSETSGFAVSAGQIGVYSSWGANPDDSINTATFRVFQSDLPVTTPEPGTFGALTAGLLLLACKGRLRRIVFPA
jgi:hypothetical protein